MHVTETVGGREVSKTVFLAEPEGGLKTTPEEEDMSVIFEGAAKNGSKAFSRNEC